MVSLLLRALVALDPLPFSTQSHILSHHIISRQRSFRNFMQLALQILRRAVVLEFWDVALLIYLGATLRFYGGHDENCVSTLSITA
jgi:hypothetical protein